jgi:hypothetical protein
VVLREESFNLEIVLCAEVEEVKGFDEGEEEETGSVFLLFRLEDEEVASFEPTPPTGRKLNEKDKVTMSVVIEKKNPAYESGLQKTRSPLLSVALH